MIATARNQNDSHFNMIKTCIALDTYNLDCSNILTSMALKNNPKTVYFLCKMGKVNKNAIDNALRSSVLNGNLDITKILLISRADVNKDNGFVLKNACIEKNIDMIKLLLSFGANPDFVIDMLRHYDLELFKLVIENYTSFHTSDKKILLDFCITSENDSNLEIIKFLIEKGARLDIYNNTLIELCICRKNTKIIKLFLEKGVSISNNTIKKCAEVSKNDSHFEITQLLYEYKANFDFENFDESNIKTLKLINQEFDSIIFRESDTCPISYEIFKKGDEKLGCVKCLNIFKKDILKEWLVFNNICPMCRSSNRFRKID